jgi:hypothetical protein
MGHLQRRGPFPLVAAPQHAAATLSVLQQPQQGTEQVRFCGQIRQASSDRLGIGDAIED